MTPEERDYVQRAKVAVENGESDQRVIAYLRQAMEVDDE